MVLRISEILQFFPIQRLAFQINFWDDMKHVPGTINMGGIEEIPESVARTFSGVFGFFLRDVCGRGFLVGARQCLLSVPIGHWER